jgi:hypothetical protein
LRPQALVSGKKKIYIVSWYILFTIPETSACDCVKAFGHVLYKKYEKNTNNKKNTKILERNTKKTMKAKEIIIKHVFSYIFGWSAVKRVLKTNRFFGMPYI